MSDTALSQREIAAVQQKFSDLRRQEYQLSQKIAELENERQEHECEPLRRDVDLLQF